MTQIPRAILFDLDGVLSDTQKLHSKVESAILANHGISISPEEIARRFSGVKNEEWFETLRHESKAHLNIQQLVDEKWEEYLGQLPGNATAILGGRELLLDAAREGWKIGVVSASRHTVVKTILYLLDIHPSVGVIIGGDDVLLGKPDPEGYLSAARQLGVSPQRCIVIEDGLAGIQAAFSGGMHSVGLGPHVLQDRNIQPDIATNSLASISLVQLDSLLSSHPSTKL